MDWIDHGVAKSQIQLSDLHFLCLLSHLVSTYSCSVMSDSLHYSLPNFSVHGILQARTLE